MKLSIPQKQQIFIGVVITVSGALILELFEKYRKKDALVKRLEMRNRDQRKDYIDCEDDYNALDLEKTELLNALDYWVPPGTDWRDFS